MTRDGGDLVIDVDGLRLAAHLARPSGASGRDGLVVCGDFPTTATETAMAGRTYPAFVDWLAEESGWTVLSFDLRGTGASRGDFSLAGWMADVKAAIRTLRDGAVERVWLAGFSAGGALALCAAGEDERVAGVASFAAPADFGDWSADPARFLARCRELGVIKTPGFPDDVEGWERQLAEIRPLGLVGKIPPRPVLLVHGDDDEVVPLVDARALADAADGDVELRILHGAGHGLRQDPRASAVLLGWLERQAG